MSRPETGLWFQGIFYFGRKLFISISEGFLLLLLLFLLFFVWLVAWLDFFVFVLFFNEPAFGGDGRKSHLRLDKVLVLGSWR